jgi:two-component system, chemotaxis family, CheB/CheR fusion protein
MKSSSTRRARRTPGGHSQTQAGNSTAKFLIAAIGASAGGIEASTELIGRLPVNTGMAFVLIHHLDPTHRSMISELLSKKTRMPVCEVQDGMKVEPDHVYVIPPDATMSISDHTFGLQPRVATRGLHMPIDQFMRSLAEAQGNCAVGVILSGTGSDGTLGLAEIQAQGGVTIAQDETSARYDGMPRSAVSAGCVDLILPPPGIAQELVRLARHPYVTPPHDDGEALAHLPETPSLRLIYQLIQRSAGLDFTHYRQTTIRRRIERRMAVNRIERVEDYLKFLQTNPGEIKALYQDMLINVTSFFRNPKVFEALKALVFPRIVRNRGKNAAIRIWSPGCASGEEIYSLGICLLEFLGERAQETPIQLFGTDVSETSISKARSGWYPQNIEADVTPARLRRFFAKVDDGYRVNKTVRDLCIFAQHNVLNDPPFSQMDLICNRNLLIYLEPVLQNHVMEIFHYATRANGFLVLGTSEGIGAVANLFAPEDRSLRIFSKKPTTRRAPLVFSMHPERSSSKFGAAPSSARAGEENWNYLEVQKEFDRRLLAQHSPATAFVNEDFELVHTRGNLSPYLKIPPGRPSLNIVKLAREGLQIELRNSLNRAKKDDATVRKAFVQIKDDTGHPAEDAERPAARPESIRQASFEVNPIRVGTPSERYFMLFFRESSAASRKAESGAKGRKESESAARRISKLEEELASTKEYLQSVIETQEATNEELQSANEEVLSSNEELQSTNEELETAKEELQSVNEELNTVNDELRERNVEMTQAQKDLTNLFSSIDIAVLTVGRDLKIGQFTSQAQKMLGLLPGDVGRPLANINLNIDIPDLEAIIRNVLKSSVAVDTELTARDGARHLLRVLPSLSTEGPQGVVLTVVAIPNARKIQVGA